MSAVAETAVIVAAADVAALIGVLAAKLPARCCHAPREAAAAVRQAGKTTPSLASIPAPGPAPETRAKLAAAAAGRQRVQGRFAPEPKDAAS